MKENKEINDAFVRPLDSVVGSTLKAIRAQDNLKYWELEFNDGQILYFDTMNHGGFFGKVVQNATSAPARAESENALGTPQSDAPQLGCGSGAAPCSAGSGVADKQDCIPERMLECVRDDLRKIMLNHGDKSLEYDKALRDTLSYIKRWLLPILDRAVVPQSQPQSAGVRGTSRPTQTG